MQELTELVYKLQYSNDYNDYGELEHKIFQKEVELQNEKLEFEKEKADNKLAKIKKFDEVRPNQKSKADADKIVEKEFADKENNLNKKEAEISQKEEILKASRRIAEYYKGYFINQSKDSERF